MIALGFFASNLVLAMEGPIVVHRESDLEGSEARGALDSLMNERGYADAQWMTPADLAGTFDVHSIWARTGVECEEWVEGRVWLERLDRMEMRIQILDFQTALELGDRLWLEQVCLQEVPARRDLQRLAVSTARAHWLDVQTAQTDQEVGQAQERVRETMEGLGRLGHDLVLPAGLEPELQALMLGADVGADSVVMGACPDGRLAIDGQRIASGVVRRKPGKHLVQVDDPELGAVVSARIVELEPGRVLLWAGELGDGALEGELQAALAGASIEPGLLKSIANGLGCPLFFFSQKNDVATLRRHDGSVVLLLEKGARRAVRVGGDLKSEKQALGLGPSIGGVLLKSEQSGYPRGMGGLIGWVRVALQQDILLVGSVGYRARQDPLPAQMEEYWATTWEVPVRVGLRFFPLNAVWETGVDGELRWESSTEVALQGGVSLVLGRTAALGPSGTRLRTEAHAGLGPGWLGLGLQTGVEFPW